MDAESTDSSQEETENQETESANESSTLDANTIKSAENFTSSSSSSFRSTSSSFQRKESGEEWAEGSYMYVEREDTENQHPKIMRKTKAKHSSTKRELMENHSQESSVWESKTSEEKVSQESMYFEGNSKRRKDGHLGNSLFKNTNYAGQKSEDTNEEWEGPEAPLTDNECQVAYSRESVMAALARLRLANAKLEQELSKAKEVISNHEEKDKAHEKWPSEKELLQKEAAEEKKRFEKMSSYAKSLEARYRRLRDQKEQLKGNGASMTKQHQTDQDEVRRLEMENKALRCAVQMGKECLREEADHSAKLRKMFKKMQQDSVKLKDAKAQLEMQLEQLQTEFSDDQREKSAIETQLENKRSRLHEQAEVIQRQKEELAKCYRTIRCLEKEIRHLRSNEGDARMTRFVQKQCEEELEERTEEVRSLKTMMVEKDRRISGLLYLLTKNNNGTCVSKQKNKEGVDSDEEEEIVRFLQESDKREKKIGKEKKEGKKQRRVERKYSEEHEPACGCCICLRKTYQKIKECCTEDEEPRMLQEPTKDLVTKRLVELERKVEANAKKLSQKIETLKSGGFGNDLDHTHKRMKADEGDKHILRFLGELDEKVEANAKRISRKIKSLKRSRKGFDEQSLDADILRSSPSTVYTDPRSPDSNKKINEHILKLINELDAKVEINAYRISQKMEEIREPNSRFREEIARRSIPKVLRESKDEGKAEQSVVKLLNEMDEKFETNIKRISEKLEALRSHSNEIRKAPEDDFGKALPIDFLDGRATGFTQGRINNSLVQRLMANSAQQQEILATLSESIDRNAREVSSMVGNLRSDVLPTSGHFFHDEECSVHQKLRLMLEENQQRSFRTKAVFQSLMKHSEMERALLELASAKLDQPVHSASLKKATRSGRKSGGKETHKRHEHSGHKRSGDKRSGHKYHGDKHSRDKHTGDKRSGHKHTGDKRSGHKRPGDKRSGHKRSGYKRSGDKRPGHKYSGDKHSGDKRSGHKLKCLEYRLVHKIRQEFNQKLDDEANRLEMKIDGIHYDLKRVKGHPFTEVIVDDGSRSVEAKHHQLDRRDEQVALNHEVEKQTKELLQEMKDIKRDKLNSISQLSDLSHLSFEKDELVNKVSERINEKAQGLEEKIERILDFIKQEKERKLLKKEKKKKKKEQHRQSIVDKGKPIRRLSEKIEIAKDKLKESERRLSLSSVDTTIQESLNEVATSALRSDAKSQKPQEPVVDNVAQQRHKPSLIINAPESKRLIQKPPQPAKKHKSKRGRKAKKPPKHPKVPDTKKRGKAVKRGAKSAEKQASSSSLSGSPAKGQTNESAEMVKSLELEALSEAFTSEAQEADATKELPPKQPERKNSMEEKGQQTLEMSDEPDKTAFTKQDEAFNEKIKHLGTKLDYVLEEIENRHLWSRSSAVKAQSSSFLIEHNEFINDHMQHLKEQLDRVLQELSTRHSMPQATIEAAQDSDLEAQIFEMRCIQRHLERQSVLVVAQRALLRQPVCKRAGHRDRKAVWKRMRRLNRQMAQEQLKINCMVRKVGGDIEENPSWPKASGEKEKIEEDDSESQRSKKHKRQTKGEISAKVKSIINYQKQATKKKKKKKKHKENTNLSNQLQQETSPSVSTEATGDGRASDREIPMETPKERTQNYNDMISDVVSQIIKVFPRSSPPAKGAEEESNEYKSSSCTGSDEAVNWCSEENDNYTKTILQSEYCVNESSESKTVSPLIADEDDKPSDQPSLSRKDEEHSIRCPTLVLSQARDMGSSSARDFIENLFSSRAPSDAEERLQEKMPISIFFNRQVSSSQDTKDTISQAQAFVQDLFSPPSSDKNSESKTSSSEKQSDSNGSSTKQGNSTSRTNETVTSPAETSTERSDSDKNNHQKTSPSKESEETQSALQDSRRETSSTTAEVRKTSSSQSPSMQDSSSGTSHRNRVKTPNHSLTAVSSSEQTRTSSPMDSDDRSSSGERNPARTDTITRSLIWPKHFNAASSISNSSSPNRATQRATDSLSERYSSCSTTEVDSKTDSAKGRITQNYLPPVLFQRSSSSTSRQSDRRVAQFLDRYLFSDSGSDQREQRSCGTQFSRFDCVSRGESSSACEESRTSTPRGGSPVEMHASSR